MCEIPDQGQTCKKPRRTPEALKHHNRKNRKRRSKDRRGKRYLRDRLERAQSIGDLALALLLRHIELSPSRTVKKERILIAYEEGALSEDDARELISAYGLEAS